VHSDAGFHGVWAEVPTGAGREEGIVAVTTTFLSPDAQDRDVAGGQRDTALLAAFTLASNVSVGVELDVAAGEPGQLGKPQCRRTTSSGEVRTTSRPEVSAG
jgi:hypothetical protein